MTIRRTRAFGVVVIAVAMSAPRAALGQTPAPEPTPAPPLPAPPPPSPAAPPSPSPAPEPAQAPAAPNAATATPESEDVVPQGSKFPTVFSARGLEDAAEDGPVQSTTASDPASPMRYVPGANEPRRTVGMLPSKPDLGAEADIVSVANEVHPPALDKRWTYVMAGYLRAPARVGLGPRNDFTPGQELHAPPRVVGLNANEWTNVALAPGPEASLYVTVENARAAGTVIIQANTFWDVGFKNVESLGGISQAYVTLKFPDAFGQTGGLAWTIGGFSNRYGNAGPRQQSSGYYQTQLFGRTHVLGEALTGEFRLSEGLTLVLEHGIGAKTEVVPYLNPGGDPRPPRAPWLPEQGPVPQGSTFVHHAHAALDIGSWLWLAAHYMTSWSPDDFSTSPNGSQTASLDVLGAEMHFDDDSAGHGYLGYSHVKAEDILPLADGLEVLHSRNGLQFTENYFDVVEPEYYQVASPTQPLAPVVDSGSVDTILAQYLFRLGPALGWRQRGPDLRLAVFGMYNTISTVALEQNRLKFGGEVSVRLLEYLSGGVRFDQVRPDGNNARVAYSALTPRLVLHTTWINREYVLLSYTRYFLGEDTTPSRPYDNLGEPDPNMFVLSGAVTF